ncbi:hypothetical protein QG37_06983 [Candidozyma auris]|nr:hypothetical protein QG37_06983 [[Candida] auris]
MQFSSKLKDGVASRGKPVHGCLLLFPPNAPSEHLEKRQWHCTNKKRSLVLPENVYNKV